MTTRRQTNRNQVCTLDDLLKHEPLELEPLELEQLSGLDDLLQMTPCNLPPLVDSAWLNDLELVNLDDLPGFTQEEMDSMLDDLNRPGYLPDIDSSLDDFLQVGRAKS